MDTEWLGLREAWFDTRVAQQSSASLFSFLGMFTWLCRVWGEGKSVRERVRHRPHTNTASRSEGSSTSLHKDLKRLEGDLYLYIRLFFLGTLFLCTVIYSSPLPLFQPVYPIFPLKLGPFNALLSINHFASQPLPPHYHHHHKEDWRLLTLSVVLPPANPSPYIYTLFRSRQIFDDGSFFSFTSLGPTWSALPWMLSLSCKIPSLVTPTLPLSPSPSPTPGLRPPVEPILREVPLGVRVLSEAGKGWSGAVEPSSYDTSRNTVSSLR